MTGATWNDGRSGTLGCESALLGSAARRLGTATRPRGAVDRRLGGALDAGLHGIDTAACDRDSEASIGRAFARCRPCL